MQAPNYFWQKSHPLVWILWPIAFLYGLLVSVRQWLYQQGLLISTRLPVPVIIVGNITLGGTGKTPLVVALSNLLQAQGYQPGIVLRGYGGKTKDWPQLVNAFSDPVLVGDEAVLLAKRTGQPVCADPDRAMATRTLLAKYPCDLVIADDGLQHYALQRDIEIAVIDDQRGLGNGFLLPAGPLREKASRLETVDFVITNTLDNTCVSDEPRDEDSAKYWLRPKIASLVNLATGDSSPLADFVGHKVHAVAGIGHPQRFFALLEKHGLLCTPHAFADHHAFCAGDLDFAQQLPIIMTEKDAVKCRSFATKQIWFVALELELDQRFVTALLDKLQTCMNHKGVKC